MNIMKTLWGLTVLTTGAKLI